MPFFAKRATLFPAMLLAALCSPALAQQPATCDYRQGKTVTLTFLDTGLPLIGGAMNGSASSFLFDTGASQTNLLMPKLKELGVFVMPMKKTGSGAGGLVTYSMTKLATLDIGPFRFKNQYLHVITNLHPKLMGKFDAILGMEHLAPNDFEVDIQGGQVALHTGQCRATSTVTWEADAMSLPLNPGLDDITPAQFTVTIQGRPVKAIFDTAAARSFLNQDVAAELGIVKPPDAPTANAVGAGEKRLTVWQAAVKDVVIGTEKIPSANLMIQPPRSKTSTELILGLDYLRNHRVLFLLGQKKIMVKPHGQAVFSLPARP